MRFTPIALIILIGSYSATDVAASTGSYPHKSHWREHGSVLRNGPKGAWDHRLNGAITPSSVIKKDGVYFLYYVAADGDRSYDSGPRHRALGVAVSNDGINFTKFEGNPILTFAPNNGEEEGLFSAAAMIEDGGNILLYYSACSATSDTSVSCSGRLAISRDGLRFADQGEILSYQNDQVWGFGDELFPVGAFKSNDKYHVYYIAKNSEIRWGLGVASGASPITLNDSQAVISSGCYVIGGGDPVVLPNGEIGVSIIRDFDSRKLEFRWISPSSPEILSEPAIAYQMEGSLHATTIYDDDADRWLTYYQNGETYEIHVMSAITDIKPIANKARESSGLIGCPQIDSATPADNRILTRLIRWLHSLRS